MTMISTLSIGAVTTTPWNFTADVQSANGPKPFRSARFGGVLTVAQATTLSELVANSTARQTIGGVSGVLEYVTSDSPVMSAFNGYYILQTFDFVPDKIGADARYAGFSLSAVLIGDVA